MTSPRLFPAMFVLGLIASAGTSHAGDVYTFLDAKCGRYSGVLAHVSAKNILFVDLTGHLVRLPREKVDSVVIHQLLESPLAELHVDRPLKQLLRDVWIGDDSEPSFTGWATSFFDNLTIFVDINGKIHVVDPADISKLSATEIEVGVVHSESHAEARLGFPPEIVPCSKRSPARDAMPPSRVIADRIKVGDYLAKLEDSYRGLNEFEERTRVYAKPFIFEEESRFGLIYHPASELPIPIYFRWSTGRPYRFQSEITVGNALHNWLPMLTPSFSVASDAKSHFFNATFIGNIVAFPAGNDPFVLSEITDGPSSQLTVMPAYNYLILMGADYWRLSVSGGPGYLATGISVPRQPLRKVRAQKASAVARVRYQAPNFSLRGLYFRTRISGELSEVLFTGDDDAIYRFRSDAVRLGVTADIWELELSFDHVLTVGRYSEQMTADALAVKYIHSESAATISSNFGRYVTVRAFARFILRRHDVERPSTIANDNRSSQQFGGALEFVF